MHHVFFSHTDIVKECFDLVGIQVHLHTSLLAHLLLSKFEEIGGLFHHESHLVPHLISDFDLLSISHLHGVWLDSLLNEVICHLLGNLSKNCFGESYRIRFQISEGYKLDDIPVSVFIEGVRK